MEIKISDMPEDKEFSDYPEGTIFIHSEDFPRYDREAIARGKIVRILHNDPRYETAMTQEEILELAEKYK